MTQHDWDRRYLALAEHVAGWSRDPSTRVGAVIVRPDRTVASVGYNGLPRRVADTAERLHHRDTRLLMTVHAEMNAILTAREPLHGHTLYVWPFHPCASAIIQAGLTTVVAPPTADDLAERWAVSLAATRTMFAEAGVLLFTPGAE